MSGLAIHDWMRSVQSIEAGGNQYVSRTIGKRKLLIASSHAWMCSLVWAYAFIFGFAAV